jgi:integrase
MITIDPDCFAAPSGSSLDRAQQCLGYAIGAAEVVWDLSKALVSRATEPRDTPAPAPLPDWPEGFTGEQLETFLLRRNYAPATARRYRQIGMRLTAWYQDGGAATDDAGTVERFLADTTPSAGVPARHDPRHLGLTRTTLCAVRACIDRPLGRGLSAGTRFPPRPRPLDSSSVGTIEALAAAARGCRELLLLVLCAWVGLRVGQMAALRHRDIDLSAGKVRVPRRRGWRDVPIPPGCLGALAQCLGEGDDGAFVFPSAARGDGGPVSVRAMQYTLRRLIQRAGVSPGTTFETLRAAGADLPLPPGGTTPACALTTDPHPRHSPAASQPADGGTNSPGCTPVPHAAQPTQRSPAPIDRGLVPLFCVPDGAAAASTSQCGPRPHPALTHLTEDGAPSSGRTPAGQTVSPALRSPPPRTPGPVAVASGPRGSPPTAPASLRGPPPP